jgi:predicted metal-dependent hydrolase
MQDIKIDQLVREKRKTLSLQITKDARVVVKAPLLMPDFMIKNFLNEKQDWIRKKIIPIMNTQEIRNKKYTEGEKYLYLGRIYTLKFGNYTSVKIEDEFILFPIALVFRAQKELKSWFQKEAKDLITRRVQSHSIQMNTKYTSIFFSDTASKWGTCFPNNSLQFNWRLIMAPIFVLDYVVIHELAHTMEKNHGERFWKIVEKYTPAFKTHRKWLSQNGHLLTT